MKKIILLSVLLIIAFALIAQIPHAFKYQTVVRDISGDVLPNQFISLQISIRDGTAGGTIIYQENHDLTTNQFGLANLEIGLGLPIIGDFISIDWQTGLKFLEIALDPTGGNTYASMGSSQLFSVPYALYDGDWTISGNDLYTSLPGNVGIGTPSPVNGKLEVTGDGNTAIYSSSVGSNAIYAESSAGGGFAAGFFNGTNPGTYGIWAQSDDYEALYAHTFSPTHPAIRATGTIAGVFDGKVGIGTTSPQATLDVNGSINSLNNYLIDGNSVISVEGWGNLIVGEFAGKNNTGEWVTLIGDSAGYNNEGTHNLFIGCRAGLYNTIGEANTFVGVNTGNENTTGSLNTFLGLEAGRKNIDGDNNTFLGVAAGAYNTSGYGNTYLGESSGYSNETGSYNTCIGTAAGQNTPDGIGNTFLGSYTGSSTFVGDSNVFIGHSAGYNEPGSNKLIIANGPNDDNILMYGDFVSGNLGIGTKDLNHKLNINGNAELRGEDGWDDPGDLASLFLGDPNHGIKASFSEGLSLWTFDDPNHAIRFQNHTGTDYMTIKMGTGNVGIGTSDPEERLHISDGFIRFDPGCGLELMHDNGYETYIGSSIGSNSTEFLQFATGDIKFSTGPTVGFSYPRLTIKNDGNIGIGTTSPEFKLSLDSDGGIIAKGEFGLGTLLTSTGAGSKLIWYPRKAAFRVGYIVGDSWDDSNIGEHSIALGNNCLATSESSIAIGNSNSASGEKSLAVGYITLASGDYSTAMGRQTEAGALGVTAIGQCNLGGGNQDTWILTDPLFEIGNGVSFDARSNAMTVLKNGYTGIGIHTPLSLLHINQEGTTFGIRLDYSETSNWQTYVDAAQDYNFAYNGTLRGYINDSDGSYNAMSDKKLKKEITSLPKVLGKVNQLQPCTYRFKDDNSGGKKSIGLIAQEVEPLFPVVVHEKDGFKSINYDAFAVIAIQAIKEQQEIIEELQIRIQKLEQK